jgi:hypothetical protein
VVDEQLRPPTEQVGERRRALVGLEPVVLVDPDTGQLLPLPGQFVAAAGQLLLGSEELEPGCEPLLTRSRGVFCHIRSLFSFT